MTELQKQDASEQRGVQVDWSDDEAVVRKARSGENLSAEPWRGGFLVCDRDRNGWPGVMGKSAGSTKFAAWRILRAMDPKTEAFELRHNPTYAKASESGPRAIPPHHCVFDSDVAPMQYGENLSPNTEVVNSLFCACGKVNHYGTRVNSGDLAGKSFWRTWGRKVSEHTPGPWKVSLGLDYTQIHAGKVWVAEMVQDEEFSHPTLSVPSVEEMEANARLISAAPEMGAMLLSMFSNVSHGGPTREQAEALLNKAGLL